MTAFSWAYCDKHKPRLRAHKAITPCKYRCRIFKANVVPLLPASPKAKLLAKKRVQESYVNLPHFFGDRGTDVQERPAHFSEISTDVLGRLQQRKQVSESRQNS